MTDLAALAARLRRLLGPEYGVAVGDPTSPQPSLLGDEIDAVAGAVPKRQLEFTAGRAAARAAMLQIGFPPAEIPMAQDRSPVWPEGLVGSITHCEGVCLAVVARTQTARGVGIDIEPETTLPPDLEEIVCTPAERVWLGAQPSDQRGLWAKHVFSAKESAYKATYPITQKLIGFSEMTVAFSPDGAGFEARTAGMDPMIGHLIREQQHVICLTVIPPKS